MVNTDSDCFVVVGVKFLPDCAAADVLMRFKLESDVYGWHVLWSTYSQTFTLSIASRYLSLQNITNSFSHKIYKFIH